jgi:hypothetical protein
LGTAVARLNAQAKGRRLGIFRPHEQKAKETRGKKRGEEFRVEVCGRAAPAKNMDDGIRATRNMDGGPFVLLSTVDGEARAFLITIQRQGYDFGSLPSGDHR